jgi:hypothetical protein
LLFIAAAVSFVSWQSVKSKAVDEVEARIREAAEDPKRKSVMI